MTPLGHARCTLKTPYRDGTRQIVLEPLDLVARLAAATSASTPSRLCEPNRAGGGGLNVLSVTHNASLRRKLDVAGMFDRLKNKKLVQWSLAYATGGWLAIQVLDTVADPWGISPLVVRGIQFVIGVGLVAAIIVAWFHGEQGRQRVGGLEALLLLGLAAVAVTGFAIVTRSGGEPGVSAVSKTADPYFPLDRDRPAIAILPLTSLSGSPEDAYFAEGIHEELIHRLAKLSSLIVISRTSVLRFADGQTSVGDIGKQLNVNYVLEGSARRSANRVRVTSQLIDVEKEEPVWAETYDLEFTVENLFDIQIDVAHRISSALQLEISPAERTRLEARPTQNLQAYESYLLGRVAWAKRTPESLEESIIHLSRATELDPTFGLAYSALAEAYVLQPFFSDAYDPEAALARAEESARRALNLDPNLGQAHSALGLVQEFRFDWAEAEDEFLLAIEKSPEYATAHHWYANMLSRRGRSVEGLAQIRKAYELDPLSLIINQDVGYNLELDRQIEAALRQYERTLQLDPDYPTTTIVYAWALLSEGRYDEARSALERWAVLSGGNPDVLGQLVDAARAYRETGLPQELPKGLDIKNGFVPYFAPHVYLSVGYPELALDLLETALEERKFSILMGLNSPIYDGVRHEPRFVAIAQKVGIGLYQ